MHSRKPKLSVCLKLLEATAWAAALAMLLAPGWIAVHGALGANPGASIVSPWWWWLCSAAAMVVATVLGEAEQNLCH